ncbi:hypothetical protein RI129_005487 [Pyrocoelia pectoralis]|uniref:Protein lethal(3)malignant blood neoplasm 1 n=1 Tax=Pyrocoelia pectoralis TaxID=417401 RepID=A0AAN7VK70_9COLE
MVPMRWFYLLLILEVYGEKIKDEDRPYEFSFTIDSQQHRYEKKDINGIVQGEFGFITADGVYHVTVYATDENGNFKIISMKNIKISERLDRLKESELPKIPGFQYHTPTTSQQPPSTRSITTTTTKPLLTTKRVPKFLTASTIRVGCGGCGIITTPPSLEEFFKARTSKIESKPIEYSHPTIQTKERAKNFYSKPNELVTPTRTYTATTSGPKYVELSTNTFTQSTPRPRRITVENSLTQSILIPKYIAPTEATVPKRELIEVTPKYTSIPITLTPPESVKVNAHVEGSTALFEPRLITLTEATSTPKRELIEVTPKYTKKHTARPQPTVTSKNEIVYTKQLPLKIPRFIPDPSKAKVENGIIKVPGNAPIPILDKYPNMIDGLPNGITKENISDLLYKFNYTVGFHGHYEKGWRNGTKVGGYFVNGRDGYSRIVTYVADEFGYRPKFKLVRLGLDSLGTPKEDTEKSFGLQNFEFVWYPLN